MHFPNIFYLSLLTFISIYCIRKRSLTKKPLIIWLIYDVKNIEWSSVCFWRNLKKKKKLIVLKKQAENCTEGSSTVSLSTNRYFLNWRYTVQHLTNNEFFTKFNRIYWSVWFLIYLSANYPLFYCLLIFVLFYKILAHFNNTNVLNRCQENKNKKQSGCLPTTGEHLLARAVWIRPIVHRKTNRHFGHVGIAL